MALARADFSASVKETAGELETIPQPWQRQRTEHEPLELATISDSPCAGIEKPEMSAEMSEELQANEGQPMNSAETDIAAEGEGVYSTFVAENRVVIAVNWAYW